MVLVHNMNSTDGRSSISRNSYYYYYELLMSVQGYRNKWNVNQVMNTVREYGQYFFFHLKERVNAEEHIHQSHLCLQHRRCSEEDKGEGISLKHHWARKWGLGLQFLPQSQFSILPQAVQTWETNRGSSSDISQFWVLDHPKPFKREGKKYR